MTKADLKRLERELQEAFVLDVVYASDEEARRPRPCFFAAFDASPCSGRIEGCHWINRQRIKNALWSYGVVDPELVLAAEWDARWGVPGCTAHHRPFDSHTGRRLWVLRDEVPWAVEEAARDWGLETWLQERSPSFFDPGDSKFGTRNLSPTRKHELQREAIASERALFGG